MSGVNHIKYWVLFAAGLALAAPAARAAVDMQYVPVGSPGNAADPQTGYGAVDYAYGIGKYEVTNAQWVEFLNAKAKSDPLLLWNINMEMEFNGGITRRGAEGNFTYAVKPGRGNQPVGWVSWYDAARFANWLHNGQGNGSTETGAYTFPAPEPNPLRFIPRNPGAKVVVPTRDEWYKAAYFDPAKPGGPGYWDYPTRTDAVPFSDQPPGTGAPNPANTANFNKDDGIANGYDDGFAVSGMTEPDGSQQLLFTDVGAYAQSTSAFGTFDQGGNSYEWDEGFRPSPNRIFRGISGGNFASGREGLSAASAGFDNNAFTELGSIGFRVATLVPEPGAGLVLVGSSVLLLRRQRRIAGRVWGV